MVIWYIAGREGNAYVIAWRDVLAGAGLGDLEPCCWMCGAINGPNSKEAGKQMRSDCWRGERAQMEEAKLMMMF